MSDRVDTLRAFLALEPGEAARGEAARIASLLRKRTGSRALRWVAPESYHVTLHFLGTLERERLPHLGGQLAPEIAGEEAFALGLERVDAFPTPRRPRVIVLALGPRDPAERLAGACGRALGRLGFELEERALRPHLTLARARRSERPAPLQELPEVEPLSFPVREVVLFESRLGSGGSRYTPVERWPLAGSGIQVSHDSPHATLPGRVPAQED